MYVGMFNNVKNINSEKVEKNTIQNFQSRPNAANGNSTELLPTAPQIMANRGINFTGVDITQRRSVYGSKIKHVITDEFLPDIDDIHRSASLTLDKEADELNLSYSPSSAHKCEEFSQMFNSAIYTSVQEAKKLGVKSINFKPDNSNLSQMAKNLNFIEDKQFYRGDKLTLPSYRFDSTLNKLDGFFTKDYAASISADEKQIEENLKIFDSKITSLGDLSEPRKFGANPKFYKENDKVFIEGKQDCLNVRVNGVCISYNDYKKALNSGDVLKIDDNIYIYHQDKKTENNELRFIANDEKDEFSELFPYGVKELRFNQRGISDCYFLSALKALSNSPKGVELIAKMIEPLSNNRYIVRFPGCPKDKIEVSRRDLESSVSVSSDSMGVKILEHAFYKLKEKIDWKGEPLMVPSNKEEWLYNGFSEEALHILTSGKMLVKGTRMNADRQYIKTFMEDVDNNSKILDETKKYLKELHDKGENVAVGADTSITVRREGFIYPDHAYSITNIDPEHEKITINDPHASSNNYELSYNQFFKNFASIRAVELKEKLI